MINISWGLIKRTDDIVKFFNDAIDYAANKSVTVVFSAGNSNQDAKLEVPNWEKTIVVGGLDRSNSKTVSSKFKGSNWGDALTFSAPANGFTIMNNSGKYAKGAGTTLAAPHVTGLIGLMYALKGNLTLKYIKDTIAVNPINYTRDNDKYMGKGIVDVSKTIAQITRNNQSFTNNQKFFKMKDQGVQHFFDLIRDNLASYPTRKNVIDTIVQELVGGPGHCEKWCYDGSKLICCDKAHTQNLICIPVSGANIMLYDSGGALLAYEVLPVEEGFKQYKVIRKKGRKGIKKIVLELYGQTNTIILDIPI